MIRRSAALAAAVAAALLIAAGCTGPVPPRPVPTGGAPVQSADLFDRISDLRRAGQTAPLRSLTDFPWDGVYCYYEGVSTDRINADVGGRVEEPGHRLAVSGALAVFVKDGRPVRRALIPEINFRVQRYSSDVLLRAGFELVEPATAASPSAATG